MNVKKYFKIFFIMVCVCLCIAIHVKSILAEGATGGETFTYYVGGTGASDDNDGLSSTKAFATLYKATNTINLKGNGSYVILIQGDTTETQTSYIGTNSNSVNITLKNILNNAYTINRGSNLKDMIIINGSSSLSLGDQNWPNTINLIINGGNNQANINSSIINNNGTLNLYNGVSLQNNKGTANSAINNLNIFNMYGGEICNNESNFGAVFNSHTFNMHNGKIYNNHSSGNGGGVYNKDCFNLYDGSVSANTCTGVGAGVYNSSRFTMNGGMIIDNIAVKDAGGVASEYSFVMANGHIISNSTSSGSVGGVSIVGKEADNKITGGNISANKGIGVKVDTNSSIAIMGGCIASNTTTGVDVVGNLSLGGEVSIYDNGIKSTGIVLENTTSRIYLISEITASQPIFITLPSYTKNRVILTGNMNVLSKSYSRFYLSNTDYVLNGDGRVISKSDSFTYYVGGKYASDNNNGLTSIYPFETLEKAASAIGYANGTIVIQGDLVSNQPVIILGNITIKSNGDTHTIKRNTAFNGFKSGSVEFKSMIVVYGSLILGDSNSDTKQNIIFDAHYGFDINSIAETIDIESKGVVYLYNGVTLQGNNKGSAILNKGKLNMYGGSINNNEGSLAGGVYNCLGGNFVMLGGSIENNRCEGSIVNGDIYGSGGVFNSGDSSFTMTGGSISHNSGYSSGGVYNGSNCIFHMTGGSLDQNTAVNFANGVLNDIDANIVIDQNANISAEDSIWLVAAKVINDKALVDQNNIISINSKKLLDQIDNINIKNINVLVTIAKDLQKVGNIKNVLGENILTKAKNEGINLIISIRDEEGKEHYTWSFAENNLQDSKRVIKDVNLSLTVNAINDVDLKELLKNSNGSEEENKGLIVNFNYNTDLPSLAKVRVYVCNQEGIKSGQKLYLYYYNSNTKKLESLPYNSSYIVDSYGYVSLEVLQYNNYVLLTKAPGKDAVTDIFNQVGVTVSSKNLYFGRSTGKSSDVIITLPNTLEWDLAKNKASGNTVNITFKSSKPSVVTVDSKGHLKAKSAGKSTISVKVTLYNGKTKTYKVTITVKKTKK